MALKPEEVYAILKKQIQSGGGGAPGTPGRGIDKIELTDTQGLVDTYTIVYTDGTTYTYTVTNGQDGFSPAIVENENNDESTYKLDITTKTGTITTPNLKGADGSSSGSSDYSQLSNKPQINNVELDGNKTLDDFGIQPDSDDTLNTTDKTIVGAINEIQAIIPVFGNAGSHNSIFRGKNIGTQVTDEQYAAIQAGTFDDLYIGDYWVIGGVNWRIAAFDYYYNTGDTAFAKHHAVIVPDTVLYSHNMNDTNTTDGAYVGSGMYTEGLEQAKTQIQNAFGASHVLSHRLLLTNTTTNGYASSGEWKDSIVDLMCENMVYGTMILSPMSNGKNTPYNYRIEKGQLPLFSMAPQYTFVRSQSYWLRDVVSASAFAFADGNGNAYHTSASYALGVRPAFCIGI